MAMAVFAIINGGTVVNVQVAPDDWTPPEGTDAVRITLGQAGVGWRYDGSTFTPPPEPGTS